MSRACEGIPKLLHRWRGELREFDDMAFTGSDQLWRPYITHVRLETEFVYLAVVLDGFSRKTHPKKL